MILVNSIQITNVLNALVQLTRAERVVLGAILRKFKVEQGGHNLALVLTEKDFISNQYIGTLVGYTKETVRKAKESLHARGIILIDGLTWERYQINGRRRRTGHIQAIRIAPQFCSYIDGFLKRLKPQFTFDYHKDFKTKFKRLVKAAKEAMERYFGRKKGEVIAKLRPGAKPQESLFKGLGSELDKLAALERVKLRKITEEQEGIVRTLYRQILKRSRSQQQTLDEIIQFMVRNRYAGTCRDACSILKRILLTTC